MTSPCKNCLVRAACTNPCMPMKRYVAEEIKRNKPDSHSHPDSIFIDNLAKDILVVSDGIIYAYFLCEKGNLEKCAIQVENTDVKLTAIREGVNKRYNEKNVK